jgi:ribonuclease HI
VWGVGTCGSNTGTNQTAELLGAIGGLETVASLRLHENHDIMLISDSMYVLGMADGTYSAVANLDLVDKLKALCAVVNPKCMWVKGHSGDAMNDLCDKLAKYARNASIANSQKT